MILLFLNLLKVSRIYSEFPVPKRIINNILKYVIKQNE